MFLFHGGINGVDRSWRLKIGMTSVTYRKVRQIDDCLMSIILISTLAATYKITKIMIAATMLQKPGGQNCADSGEAQKCLAAFRLFHSLEQNLPSSSKAVSTVFSGFTFSCAALLRWSEISRPQTQFRRRDASRSFPFRPQITQCLPSRCSDEACQRT